MSPFRPTFSAVALVVLCLASSGARAAPQILSSNQSSLRFHALGNGQDRARFQVDDDAAGHDASAASDVGAQGFTLELWVRGTHADNPTAAVQAGSYADERWNGGNVLLDRTLANGGGRAFAVSLCGGRVAFYTGAGDAASGDASDTSVGDRDVLDGAWHQVAVTRDAASGVKRIYVDGMLDYESPADTSRADLSYPDAGLGAQGAWDPWLVLAASKYDQRAAFHGELDELRLWSGARTASEVAGAAFRRMLPGTPALAAEYRFEEGYGVALADTSGRNSPAGVLVAGLAGDGEWIDPTAEPEAVAPITSSLPLGFVEESLFSVFELVGLELGPDGKVYALDKTGKVWSWVAPGPRELVLSIPVETTGERGLLGLAFDPGFLANGWMYVFRTLPQARSRVARFTVVNGVASPASEFVVWENTTPCDISHQSGAIHFGNDGMLYVAAGDQYVSANAQLGSNLDGKILRLAPDGSVPADNPFVGSPTVRPEIWALGLRNPFRFRVDAPTGRTWVGDVGGNGPGAWEEILLLERGANYGWPIAEGPVCHALDCSAFRPSRFHYRHDDVAHTGGYPQASIIAGPVYRGTAFPPEYRDQLYVADFAVGWMNRLELDPAGNVVAERPFALAPDYGGVCDMDVGPDGALYCAIHVRNEVVRIRWVGASNAPPLARASAAPAAGPAPLAVQFTGSASLDPDAGPQPLDFLWDFGDGASSTTADPAHVYTTRGRFEARLGVSDGVESASAITVIEVGAKPVVSNFTPANGTPYSAGETIAFSAGAVDPEDGSLPPGAFTWRVILVHETHEHPFLGPITGVTSGSFTVPATGHGPEHVHFVIELDVADSDGLTTHATRFVEPRVEVVRLRSSPQGVALLVDGEPRTTPLDYDGLRDFQHTLEAPESIVVAGQPWVFDLWSTGESTRQIAWTTPIGGGRVKAWYRPDDRVTVTCSIPAAGFDAEWRAGTGQSSASPFDAHALCFGRDASTIETGLEFALPVPRGSIVESAVLELTGASDSQGTVLATLSAYALGDAPPFVAANPTAPSLYAPLLPTSVAWNVPVFAEDDEYSSPELAALVQAIVLRQDWNAGQHVGFVLHAPAAPAGVWRCLRNHASGQPARLRVVWRPDPGTGARPPRRR